MCPVGATCVVSVCAGFDEACIEIGGSGNMGERSWWLLVSPGTFYWFDAAHVFRSRRAMLTEGLEAVTSAARTRGTRTLMKCVSELDDDNKILALAGIYQTILKNLVFKAGKLERHLNAYLEALQVHPCGEEEGEKHKKRRDSAGSSDCPLIGTHAETCPIGSRVSDLSGFGRPRHRWGGGEDQAGESRALQSKCEAQLLYKHSTPPRKI